MLSVQTSPFCIGLASQVRLFFYASSGGGPKPALFTGDLIVSTSAAAAVLPTTLTVLNSSSIFFNATFLTYTGLANPEWLHVVSAADSSLSVNTTIRVFGASYRLEPLPPSITEGQQFNLTVSLVDQLGRVIRDPSEGFWFSFSPDPANYSSTGPRQFGTNGQTYITVLFNHFGAFNLTMYAHTRPRSFACFPPTLLLNASLLCRRPNWGRSTWYSPAIVVLPASGKMPPVFLRLSASGCRLHQQCTARVSLYDSSTAAPVSNWPDTFRLSSAAPATLPPDFQIGSGGTVDLKIIFAQYGSTLETAPLLTVQSLENPAVAFTLPILVRAYGYAFSAPSKVGAGDLFAVTLYLTADDNDTLLLSGSEEAYVVSPVSLLWSLTLFRWRSAYERESWRERERARSQTQGKIRPARSGLILRRAPSTGFPTGTTAIPPTGPWPSAKNPSSIRPAAFRSYLSTAPQRCS